MYHPAIQVNGNPCLWLCRFVLRYLLIGRLKFIVLFCIGNGKSHYICKMLRSSCEKFVTVPVHEGFTVANAIEHLQELPLRSKKVGIFFNFTTLQIYVRTVYTK